MPTKIKVKQTGFGFTLIELLIVVSVIGVLAGVSVSLINPTRTQNTAEDAVRQSNLERLAQGIETYFAAEGSYPANAGSDGNPLNSGSGNEAILANYITSWPTDAEYFYNGTFTVNSRPISCLSVEMATEQNAFFKYVTNIAGSNTDCVGVVMKNCADSCSVGENVDDCVTLTTNVTCD